MNITSHKCECAGVGNCPKFRQYMDERMFDMCQTALQTPVRAQYIAGLYSKISLGTCEYKGEPLLTSDGFRKTRYQGCGCGGEPVRKTTLYQCSAPGAPREAEDNCELRCTSFRPVLHNTTDQN